MIALLALRAEAQTVWDFGCWVARNLCDTSPQHSLRTIGRMETLAAIVDIVDTLLLVVRLAVAIAALIA